MTTTRYDLKKFHKLMEQNGNTLIAAPRQSGKTFALVKKFVETRGSVFIVPSQRFRRQVDDYLLMLASPDKRRDVYVMCESVMRGRRADQIFIDEIDAYDGDLERLWYNTAPALNESGRIVAVTTPVGRRQYDVYYDLFHNIYNMGEDRWMKTVTKGEWIEMPPDHFEQERELFTI